MLLLQIVIFVGLVVVLRRILGRHLTSAAAHLQRLGAEYATRQEEVKRQLAEAEQHYREQVARAKAEAEQIMTQSQQEAESAKGRLLEEAHAESERIVQQGLESREALQQHLEQQLETRAIARAVELIQSVLPGQLREDMQSHWLDEMIHTGLVQRDAVPLQASVREARVVSACPLTVSQRTTLRTWLKERLGHDVTLAEAVDERLVIGLTLTIGSVVFDGSLASKVLQAARLAQRAGDLQSPRPRSTAAHPEQPS